MQFIKFIDLCVTLAVTLTCSGQQRIASNLGGKNNIKSVKETIITFFKELSENYLCENQFEMGRK